MAVYETGHRTIYATSVANQTHGSPEVSGDSAVISKDCALWRLHRKLDGGIISLPEPLACAFGNANTPEDWRSCIKQLEDSS